MSPTLADYGLGPLYHGTTSERAEAILESGLKLDQGIVWLAYSYSDARDRAAELAKELSSTPAVLEVRLPEDWILERAEEGVYLSRESIHPGYIAAFRVEGECCPVELYTPEQEAKDRSGEFTRMVQEQGINTEVKCFFVDAAWLEKSAYYAPPINRIEMFRTYPAFDRERNLAVLAHEAGHADSELAGLAPANELLREIDAYRRGRRLAAAWDVEGKLSELASSFAEGMLKGRPFERPVTVADLEDAKPELVRFLAELEGRNPGKLPSLSGFTEEEVKDIKDIAEHLKDFYASWEGREYSYDEILRQATDEFLRRRYVRRKYG